MSSQQIGLLTTLLLGIFIIIGSLIAFLINRKQKVVDFSLGLAFGVIGMLMAMDLLPEVIEELGLKYIYLFIIFTIIGFALLKLLDNFIPDHEEEKMTKKELQDNLAHIGVITALALAIHNIIEGMAVYSTVISNTSMGVALTLGIGFHNIPLGMVVAGTLHQSKQNTSKTILSILIVSLSTFIGGLIMFFLNIETVNPLVSGILLSITLGMLLFISFDELLPRIKESKNKKTTYTGIGVGILILLLASLF